MKTSSVYRIKSSYRLKKRRGTTSPDDVIPIIRKFADGEITDTECALEIKCAMTGESAESVKGASGDLDKMVNEFLDQNPAIIADYAKNEKAANKAIGFVMKQSGGKFSSAEVVEAVKKAIESRM